jgi:hypothetical protein
MTLPPRLQKLFESFPTRDQDVAIWTLYSALFPAHPTIQPVLQQQKLGPSITRLNRRLRGERIAVRPGVARRTYRLTSV